MADVSLEQLAGGLGAARLTLNDRSADIAERESAGTRILAWALLAWERNPLHGAELDTVVALCREVSRSLPSEWTFQPTVRSVLSHALRTRFEQHGGPADLAEALELAEYDFAQEPEDSVERVDLALNLSSLLDHKWELSGESDLVERTLSLSEWAVRTAAPGSTTLARARNNLGRAYGRRFEQTGDLESLDNATTTLVLALEEAPGDWEERGATLSGLGHWLLVQYSATGRRSDLDRSIDVHRDALAAMGAGDRSRPLALTNLAGALTFRGDYPNRESDLVEASALNAAAVSLTPADAPNRAGYLNNLATALGRQALRDNKPELLDRAIALLEEAAMGAGQATAKGLWLANLATYLRHRYELRHDRTDLERAELQAKDALASTGEGDPSRGHRLGVLARIRASAVGTQRSREDVLDILAIFRAASRAAVPLATTVLPLSYQWCLFAQEADDTEGACEAAQIALNALGQIVRTQTRPVDAEMWLSSAQGIAHAAAMAFVRCGRLQEALSALEQGRAVLFGNALRRDRADLELVRSTGRSDLAANFDLAANAVRIAAASAQSTDEPTRREMAAVEAANEALDRALVAIRKLPGLHEFSRPGAWGIIAEATSDAPLVYVSPGPNGGLALSVSRTGSNAEPRTRYNIVNLPLLTLDAVRTRITSWLKSRETRDDAGSSWEAATNELCHWAGEAFVGPLLGVLGGPSSLTVVAGGLLGLVPMHAATWNDPLNGKRHTAIDTAEFMIVPSAELRVASQRGAKQLSGGGTLVVESPTAAGHPTLRGAVDEAVLLAAIRPSAVTLRGGDANPTMVEASASEASTIHFACHAESFPDHPNRSRLLLADGSELSIRALANLDLRGCRLGVLSACETGVIGTELPDEAVSLASAALSAGAAGVVASLWSAGDVTTPLLMARMYEALEVPGNTPSQALRGAQIWLRDTTNREKLDYITSLRVSYGVDVLRQSFEQLGSLIEAGHGDQRSFGAPVYWATFAFWGA